MRPRSRGWSYAGIACAIAIVTLVLKTRAQHPSELAGTPLGNSPKALPASGHYTEILPSQESGKLPNASLEEQSNVASATGLGSTAQLKRLPDEVLEECFQAEPRDEAWASSTEGQLRAFIARQPHSNTFRVSALECRATLCEIHASTETPVELTDGPESPETWGVLAHKIPRDATLAAEFESDGVRVSSTYDKEASYTTTLFRKMSSAGNDARCGSESLESLNLKAMTFITQGKPGDSPHGLPPITAEIMTSTFKLEAYFDAEERDEKWAAATESAIRATYLAQPVTYAWQEPTIECKETLCMILASTSAAAVADLKMVLGELVSTAENLGMTLLTVEVSADPGDPSLVTHNVILLRTR